MSKRKTTKRRSRKVEAISRSKIEELNQMIVDEQCAFLAKLNKKIEVQLVGKPVLLNTKAPGGPVEAKITHAFISGERLIVMSIDHDDKSVLVDQSFVSSNG